MRQTPMGQPPRLKFYVATVLVGAIASLGIAVWGQDWQSSNVFTNGVVVILAVGLAAELSSVSLHVGSSILSIAFIPFLAAAFLFPRSEEHTSELQSRVDLVCRLLLE